MIVLPKITKFKNSFLSENNFLEFTNFYQSPSLLSPSNPLKKCKIIDISMTVINNLKLTIMKYYKTTKGLKYIKIYEVHAFDKENKKWVICNRFTTAKGAKNWIKFAETTFNEMYEKYYTNMTLVWCDYINK